MRAARFRSSSTSHGFACSSGCRRASSPGTRRRGTRLWRANGVVFSLDGHKKTSYIEADFALRSGEEFTVPAGRPNLILEIVVLQNPMTAGQDGDRAKDYPVDSEASTLHRGGMVRFGAFCPPAARPCIRADDGACAMAEGGTSGAWPGSQTAIWIASGVADRPACAWIGPPLQQGIPLPWPPCELLVTPELFFPGTTDEFDDQIGQFRVSLRVPDLGSLIGQSFGVQFAASEPAWPDGIGVSSGFVVTIGSGGPSDQRYRMVFAAVGENDPLPETGLLEIATPVIEFY